MIPYKRFTAHPEDLRWGLIAASILDTLLSSSPDTRYHTYLPNQFPGVDLGILDRGTGDKFLCFFDNRHGCMLKGFDHESSMSPHASPEFRVWPGLLDEVPSGLLALLEGTENWKEETTFCIWRNKGDKHWWQGDVQEPEGGEWSHRMLDLIFQNAESYLDWACEYYNRKDLPAEPVFRVYESCRVNSAIIQAINPKADLDAVWAELAKLGVTAAKGTELTSK
jgi:hypothetical protein